ncbi:MAG: phosphoglycerate dehydrogenase [Planctomycetota bacterium]|nr:phosphoglycerate dehydrogenase [Planctomycetota bacterium]
MAKVLIADKVSGKCVEILREAGIEADVRTGLSEDALCGTVGGYDGLIVRSATTVTAKVVKAGMPRLRIIGRAGVGVDNIDVEAATEAGIVVQNTPTGNIVSAAEHALAMLLALARNIPAADALIKKGKWEKKALTGVELAGKTLGIVGIGKVGARVAKAARAMEMEVVVFDPFITDRKAAELGVVRTDLETLLKKSDFVSIHAPLTDKTRGMISARELGLMKKTARIVNCARGGIIVEKDLAAALAGGRIAGAALDVFEEEPLPADSPLTALPNVVLTPHLGASTEEAQERVSEEIARQFVDFFVNHIYRNAVNVAVTLSPDMAPYARLARRLGDLVAQLADEPVRRLTAHAQGRIAGKDCREISLMALRGLLARSSEGPVTLVNVERVAEERGVELVESKSPRVEGYSNLITVSVEAGSRVRSAAGTVFDNAERIVGIDGFAIDFAPSPNVLLMFYDDRPGKVGQFGSILGEADINIATMAVGRKERRGAAVVALILDDPVPPAVLERLRKIVQPAELRMLAL